MTSQEEPSLVGEKHGLQIEHSIRTQHHIPSVFSNNESWDAWRHFRMYADLRPLLDTEPKASWLTIGDTGADAAYIRGSCHGRVVASSITRTQLDMIADKGFLKGIEIAEVNAEETKLPDRSFDYVYCKEAYHHFARPAMGFYEMIRISRKAIILCEPLDPFPSRILDELRLAAKYLLRGQGRREAEFEEAGNFVFRLSVQEIRKMATAYGCRRVYWRYFNDFFIRKFANQPRSDRIAGLVLKTGIAVQDIACRLKLMNWGLCTVVIWTCEPEDEIDRALCQRGFTRFDVPANPYVPFRSEGESSSPVECDRAPGAGSCR